MAQMITGGLAARVPANMAGDSALGVVILDADQRVVLVNDGYLTLFALDDSTCRPGTPFAEMLRLLAERGEFGPGDVESLVSWRMMSLSLRQTMRIEWVRPDGRVVVESGASLPSGGFYRTFADVSLDQRGADRHHADSRATVLALAHLAEFRDQDTGDHVVRVARLTHEITRTLHHDGCFAEQITREFREHIAVASILHDVGKVAVADSVLRKTGLLTPEERLIMQEHAQAGSLILEEAQAQAPESIYLRLGQEIARHHHERFDGAGYPDRLDGDDIPLAARIVAVADVFDALTSERPYKKAWSEDGAIGYLITQAGQQFDPEVVRAAVSTLEERRQTPVFRWDQSMSVGNATLDHDHCALIALINQLAHPSNRHDRIVLEFVLDELLSYTVSHFSREEAHMERMGFSGLDRHKTIHRRLTTELGAIRSRFLTGNQDIGDEVWQFLADWLRDHILREDRCYAPH